jgi:hypothetical protein
LEVQDPLKFDSIFSHFDITKKKYSIYFWRIFYVVAAILV